MSPKGEWNGRWSDKDAENMTAEAQRALQHATQDDGVFWMLFSDFVTTFTSVDLCQATRAYCSPGPTQ